MPLAHSGHAQAHRLYALKGGNLRHISALLKEIPSRISSYTSLLDLAERYARPFF